MRREQVAGGTWVGAFLRWSLFSISLLFLVIWLRPAWGAALRPVRVGTIPVADLLPLYAAVEMGYFREEGLELELIPMKGGAVILPAVAGGSVDIGFSNVVSTLLAHEAGFDFLIIADNNYIGPSTDAALVRAGSAIKSFKELEGKRVAVNTLNGVAWLYFRERLVRAGADPEGVAWVEVPFPQMGPALISGQVEAASVPEPFLTALLEGGGFRSLGFTMMEVDPGGILANYVASRRWIERNKETAERFARAHRRGVDYVTANSREARGLLVKYAGLKPEIAAKIGLSRYRNYVDMEGLRRVARLMERHRLLRGSLDVGEIVYRTAQAGQER